MKWPRLLMVALGTLIAAQVEAATSTYSGESTLWQDTVWSGEVLVDGILTVAPGVTLEIRPGTTVRFSPMDSNGDGIGEHELFVQGVIKVVGSQAEPILFTSAAVQPVPGDWGALNLMGGETESRFEHCQIEYAYRGFHAHFAAAQLIDVELRRNVRGMQFQEAQIRMLRCRVVENHNGVQFRDSQVQISDCVVADNYWGVRGLFSRGRISNSRFERNLINGVNLRDSHFAVSDSLLSGNRRGLYLQRGSAQVAGNRIVDNSEHGILLEQTDARVTGNRIAGNGRSGVKWVSASGELLGNDFAGAGSYALINDGPTPVVAHGNWWGSSDVETIARLIRDGLDRPGAGPVDASSCLSAPPLPSPQPVPGVRADGPAATEERR